MSLTRLDEDKESGLAARGARFFALLAILISRIGRNCYRLSR
jgi:hypothetical protein